MNRSHPALTGDSTLRFRDLLAAAVSNGCGERGPVPRLEVAMGLETAHPKVLEKLNKRMTLEQFSRSSGFLRQEDVAVRAFILVQPPFMQAREALFWAQRSLEFAFDSGACVAVLIPTRPGNGALESLRRQGQFTPPRLALLEAALDYGLGRHRGRVFADLWDLEKFADCPSCFPARAERLRQLNLYQEPLPAIACPACDRSLEASLTGITSNKHAL